MISSKEALEYFVALTFLRLDKEGAKNCGIIKKDLDVLEILKKKKVVIDWNSNDVFTFDEHLTKEEENKIKEWMKNDN